MQNMFFYFLRNFLENTYSFLSEFFQVNQIAGDLIFEIQTIEHTDFSRRNADLHTVRTFYGPPF